MSLRVAALLAALVLPVAAMAQVPPEPGGALEPREEAGRLVDAYILSNLQESLGLSDEQFVKLLPLVKRLQADRREAMQRRRRSPAATKPPARRSGVRPRFFSFPGHAPRG